jgi:alpha-L-rhamnosidase
MHQLSRILSVAVCFIGLYGSASAESPSDHVWKGRWIGPHSAPALDLNGANWIWADEPGVDPVKTAPAGSRILHRSFVIPANAKVLSAGALFSADNRFVLTVNGKRIGGGENWQQPTALEMGPGLKPGENELIVEVINDPDQGTINAAAVIGKVRVELEGAAPIEVVTDASWSSSSKPVKVIGPLGSGPWQGMATGGNAAHSNLWTCYRKEFEISEIPANALSRIAVDSKYWLWVNGKLVVREGGVKRGPNPSDTYFDEIDLAPYLVKGHNQIAVLAWFFGKDGFSHKNSGTPGLLFELNAGSTKVVSDSSWKMLKHPSFGQASNVPNFRLAESSVRFDARNEPMAWQSSAFDDASWHSATDLGAPPCAPWNRLWQRSIPQWKDFGLKDYANALQLPKQGGAATIKALLPYNAQITPWFRITAPAGVMIRMSTDNSANEIIAEYLTREGEQEFETPAWMSGHAVIYQIPEGVTIHGLKYRESGYDTEFTGYFKSDNPFLNQLAAKCERTLYINMRDTFFDCPDRERAAWWGDIVIQLAQVFHTFDPKSHALIRKCMYNLANWQRPSKTFFSPIPAGNWDKELPQQMLASIGHYGFWTYYLHTGDKQALVDLYPNVKDYLSIWQIDGDGLIVHRSGENGWDWADWGENVDIRVLDQAWFCLALEGAAKMADTLARPEEAAAYRKQRESIIAATNAKFWNGSAYRDPAYKGATDDRAQGMAVVSGIAGPEKFPAIRKVLSESFHASPYLEKYILEALFVMGDSAAALARMQSRYKEMVESETSTLWELFTRDGTLNHAWTGGPLALMHSHVAGVMPTAPGYSEFRVHPQLGGLARMESGFDSVKGRIQLKIVKEAEQFHLALNSPPGTKATVCIPLAELGHQAVRIRDTTVWLNGKSIGVVPGLVPGPLVKGHATFVVEPGNWKFESR